MATAIISRDGEEKRYLSDAESYKGYLVQPFRVGAGKVIDQKYWTNGFDDAGVDDIYESYETRYKAFINRSLIPANVMQELKDMILKDNDIRSLLGTEYEQYLVKIGENEGGLFVSFKDEQKDEAISEDFKKSDVIDFNIGSWGLTTMRLPLNVWNVIKPFGTYHKGDDSDLEWADDQGIIYEGVADLKGWFYTDGAVTALVEEGYNVSYRGRKVTSDKSITEVKNEIRVEEKAYNDRLNSHLSRGYELRKEFAELQRESEMMTEQQVEAANIYSLCEMTFSSLFIEGHNIYGGGLFLAEDGKYTYFVENNGADGDDWSRNNLHTGGAGAIVTRLEKTKTAEWMEKAAFYQKEHQEFLK